MALRLEIISSQRQQLGSTASIVLGVSGGSVGRALDNDWYLPDPHRYLSGHHARFHSRQGAYYLEDTSTNGVFVNESATPQGRQGLYALRDGDVLRMGEYRIRVHVDEEDSLPAPGASTLSRMSIDNVVPLRAVGAAGDDLGASLNIEALIPPAGADPSARFGARAEHHAGKAALSAQQRLIRLRAAARARLEGSAAPPLNVHNGMQAFCRGAGIDPTRVPMEDEAQSLHLVGRLLREAIIGLKEILRAQQAFRDRYRLEAGALEGLSPLERGTDEYLQELFSGHDRHQFDAVMQLRDGFTRAGQHDAAVDPAFRAALAQFLTHLSPARMESGAGGASDNGWTRYKEIYGNLLQNAGEEVPHLFLEAIAQAYASAMRGKED